MIKVERLICVEVGDVWVELILVDNLEIDFYIDFEDVVIGV